LSRFLEYLSSELEKGKDLEWNLMWVKNLLKFQSVVLSKYKESGGRGRALLLKVYSSLQFYDQSVKKM